MNRQMTSGFRKVLSCFIDSSSIINISRTGSGHIHETYLIETKEKSHADYILQKINDKVFPDVELLMKNISLVSDFILRQKLSEKSPVPELITSRGGKLFVKDDVGNSWRLYRHISNSKSYDLVPNHKVSMEAGKAYGRFISSLSDFPVNTLVPVIRDFHSLRKRFSDFELALKSANSKRLDEARTEIDFANKMYGEMMTIQNMEKAGSFPVRVTHNDTKINNVLYDEADNAICVIDLDTVMPGLLLHDFGDAIRTAAATAPEDEQNLSLIGIDLEIFREFTTGFLESTFHVITKKEVEHLAGSASYITFIMGLRFLTDFLNNDVYFSTHHPAHNLIRTRAQFRLLECMEAHFTQMNDLVMQEFGKLSGDKKNQG